MIEFLLNLFCDGCQEQARGTALASERRESSSDPECPFENRTGKLEVDFDDVQLPLFWTRKDEKIYCPKCGKK